MPKYFDEMLLTVKDIATVKPRQVPVCLCIDCSYSMKSSGKIKQLNESIRKFIERNANDTNVCDNLTLCIIAYGGEKARVINNFTNIKKIRFKDLIANGGTPMGEAVSMAVECIKQERQLLREEGVPTNKPLLFIFGDGRDNFPNGPEMKKAIEDVNEMVEANKLKVQVVGVGDFEKEDLQKFCPGEEIKTFSQFEMEKIFDMLSKSVTGASTELAESDWSNIF